MLWLYEAKFFIMYSFCSMLYFLYYVQRERFKDHYFMALSMFIEFRAVGNTTVVKKNVRHQCQIYQKVYAVT